MHKKVFVVISRNHARVWTDGLEPHTSPVVLEEQSVSTEYRTILNKFFNGRDRSQLSPAFAEQIVTAIDGVGELYLVGAGKGKASAVANFVSYLRKQHPQTAERVRRIETLDIPNMTEPEIMAEGRRLFELP